MRITNPGRALGVFLATAAGTVLLLSPFVATAHPAAAACSIRSVGVKRVMPIGTSLYALYHTAAPVSKAWFAVYEPGTRTLVATGARWSTHQGTTASPATLGLPQDVELEPGTRYDYVLSVEDAAGCRFYARGSARTLERLLEVTFDRAYVADDGDDTAAGELYVRAKVHDTISSPNVKTDVTVTAPATLALGYTMKVTGVPRSVTAQLMIADDDVSFGEWNCWTDFAPTWSKGSNACWDWATATIAIDLPRHGQSGRGTFTTYAAGGTAFEVTGTWRVRYVP